MSNVFKITEDELNFILGSDDFKKFDIYVALAQESGGGDPETSTGELRSGSEKFADPPVLGNFDDFDSQHPQLQVTNDGDRLSKSKFADPPVFEDFQDFAFDMSVVDDVASPLDVNLQDHFHPVTPDGMTNPPRQEWPTLLPPPPYSVAVTATKFDSIDTATPATAIKSGACGGALCNSFSPVARTAHTSLASKRPSRKRRSEVPDYVFVPADTYKQQSPAPGSGPCLREFHGQPDPAVARIKAAEARIARSKRRRLRARHQAINLEGRGDISEIERRAVADSDLVANDPCLLSDYAKNFDPEMFAAETFEGVCRAMMEASDAAESSCDMDSARSASPIISQPGSDLSKANEQAAFAPPTSRRRSSLPSGKDPESRKLRRLMRNRLSAQASRDRRKKAIADAQRIKSSKESEIKVLKEAVSEEIQRMILLEKAVSFAQEYLGPGKYSKVAAAAAGHGASNAVIRSESGL